MIIHTLQCKDSMNETRLSDSRSDNSAHKAGPTSSLPVLPVLTKGIANIKSYGIIRVSGEDALNFLHNQLTQDFNTLLDGQARFCSFCNAKGRIQASFIGFKSSASQVLLVCSKDLIAQTVKRLSMFVLRSKVKVEDASSHFYLYGLIGDAEPTVAATVTKTSTPTTPTPTTAPKDLGSAPWKKISNLIEANGVQVEQHWIRLYPALGLERTLCVSSAEIQYEEDKLLSENTWNLSDVMSGVCLVGLPTFESFVPQMINYESLEGVHFQKGCYPGQEVVARSQFRGTIKRRGFLISCSQRIEDGQALFLESELGTSQDAQPCGQVLRVAEQGGIYYGFASLQLTATEEAPGRESSPQIIAVTGDIRADTQTIPLPYKLRDDI